VSVTETVPAGEDPVFEHAIARILREGLYLSTFLIIVGITLSAIGGPPSIDYQGIPRPMPGSSLGTWGAFVVFVGLTLLVLTPVFRVAYASYLFRQRRDHDFVAITLFVLGVLALTIVAGWVH
jgi:uncharacterized membrane protein